MVLNSCGNETSRLPQIYNSDPDLTATYETLGAGTKVPNFHLEDGILCYLGHLCVPLSDHAKIIWEAHYSWVARHLGVEKTIVVLKNYFY